MRKVVPILITWDIDPTPETTIENKKQALELITLLLKDLQMNCTFLFHANIANRLENEILLLIKSGHEIGCHGLTHGSEEEYDKMPEDLQRTYLNKATDILKNITNRPIKTFRGPRVKTSHITDKILEELGYTADCSVGSQRIDFVSSNLINVGWIFAPRLPYHPSKDNVFKRGEQKIWVIPVSAIALPFISSTLYAFKLKFMKYFFDILYKESLRTGKPIVYLAHPSEFAPQTIKIEKKGFSFGRIKTHGFSFRSRFYEKDVQKKFKMNKDLFIYMKTHPNIQFMSVSDYVSNILAQRG
ncbi:MAG: polysaccharide deacetylase family protein [Candidatus Omnitrophica bacterium]|nr:polysaccharide deacetylase family protein [Candidatus Omnitrophota bacterium]